MYTNIGGEDKGIHAPNEVIPRSSRERSGNGT